MPLYIIVYKLEGDKYDLANIYYHLGNVNLESEKKQDMTLLYYTKAYKLFNDLNNDFGTALSQYCIGKAYLYLKQYTKAMSLFDAAIILARKAKTRKVVMGIYYEYALLHKENGRYKNAFGALTGLAELLELEFETMTDFERKELIVEIRKATKNTHILLLDLLTWSQAQRGTIEFAPIMNSIRKVCSENVDFISAEAHKKKDYYSFCD